MNFTRYRRALVLPRVAGLPAGGCLAAVILLAAGGFLYRPDSAPGRLGARLMPARSLTSPVQDSSAFKLVYAGTYSYDYTKRSDQTGEVLDHASANYTWTYTGTETLTAAAGNPAAFTSSGSYQMLSSGHQLETSVNYDCSLDSGPHDAFAYTTVNDPAVGHETSMTSLTFGWSIANPPAPANATRCSDGTTFNSLGFPIPPSANGVDPGSFLDQTAALQAALQTRAMPVRFGQLPYTLPIAVNVPERTVDDGTFTQSGHLQLHAQVTFSAINDSCPVRPAAVAAHPASGGLAVSAGPPAPQRAYFRSFKLKLSAYAGGGCGPYVFTWKLLRRPNDPPTKGVRVTVKPVSQIIPAPASSAIQVVLTCAVSARIKRQYGVHAGRFLTPCGGPVDYQILVRDSSQPAKTGNAVIHLHWAPECLEPGRRAQDIKERRKIEYDLYKKLAADQLPSITLEKVIEYVTEGEFAPAFFLKDLAQIGIDAQNAFQKAEMLDAELTDPDC